jgi:hypothetical protein
MNHNAFNTLRFIEQHMDGIIQKILPNLKVACLQITVTKRQQWWAIVKEIAVFIK